MNKTKIFYENKKIFYENKKKYFMKIKKYFVIFFYENEKIV